jgi:hypothetical protein
MREVVASAGYMVAVGASLWVSRDDGGLGFGLMPLEFVAAIGAGLVIARWRALLLGLATVPLMVIALLLNPHGSGDSPEAAVALLGFVVGPVLAVWPTLGLLIGVAVSKGLARRAEPHLD